MTATTSGPEASRAYPRSPAPEGATPLEELLGPVRRRWRLVAACSLAAGVLAAIVSLLLPPVFTAQTTFTPVAASQGVSGGLASLVGLAGQLGLSSLTSGGSISPEYFAEVLHSRSILQATLESRFPVGDSAGTARTLLEILDVKARTPQARMEAGLQMLDDRVIASVDKRTGIINLRVRWGSPVLAAGVANRLVALLNAFNLDRRQVQSREQRRFTGERAQEAKGELAAAEGALLKFLETNREYRGSPVLEYQASKLQRDVQVKQEIYLTLTKAFEEARIAEVRDIPVITIIDEAVPPVLRSSPRRKLNTLLGLFLGGLLGIAAAYLVPDRRPRGARGDLHHAG